MKTEIDSNFSNVYDAIVNIQGAITIACERIDDRLVCFLISWTTSCPMAYPCKKLNPTNENGKHL
jgi:hypothetical protein